MPVVDGSDVYQLPSSTGMLKPCEPIDNPFHTGSNPKPKHKSQKSSSKDKTRRSKKTNETLSTLGSNGKIKYTEVDLTRISGLISTNSVEKNDMRTICEQRCYLLNDGVCDALVKTSNTKSNAKSSGKTLLGFSAPSVSNTSSQSLVETLHGGRVYVPLWNQHYMIALSGFFKVDSFQATLNHMPLFTKHRQLRKLVMQSSVIPDAFSSGWLQQLSLRDLLVYNSQELSDQCIRNFQRLQLYKSKTISTLVKEFLSSSLAIQRDILTLFLLTEQDSDTQYLAYLMYDMISQESLSLIHI